VLLILFFAVSLVFLGTRLTSPPCRLQDNGQLDFSDPAATMQLTKTLLAADFGLELTLPEDRLCPPVWSSPGVTPNQMVNQHY
jgi:hypothetical protein